MKSRYKRLTSLALSLSMALGISLPAWASPDTSVDNKVNFSTDVIYQIVTDRFADGDRTNNPAGMRSAATDPI